MRLGLTHILILSAFAIGLGHVCYSTLSPPPARDYVVRGDGKVLRTADGDESHVLCLRRKLVLPRRPDCAWMQVLGQDYLEVFVNGTRVDLKIDAGHTVATLADLTPLLRAGENVLAISSQQWTTQTRPQVAVEGAYWLAGVEHRFAADEQWRYQTFFERRGDYWFGNGFDDGQWLVPAIADAELQATITHPPRAITTPDHGRWITPSDATAQVVGLRRGFELPERARWAWLRVWSTAPYRLSVNGVAVDAREEQLGTTRAPAPAQWVYDVSAVLQPGRNTIGLSLNTQTPPPHVVVDLEIKGRSGRLYTISTDEDWRWMANPPDNWQRGAATGWSVCVVEAGHLGPSRWATPRRLVETDLPWGFHLRRFLGELAAIVGIWLASWLACRWMHTRLVATDDEDEVGRVSPAALMFVLPATILLGAMLVTYDPGIPRNWTYNVFWPAIAILSIIGQWVYVQHLRQQHRDRPQPETPATNIWIERPRVVAILMTVILLGGAYLRISTIAQQPLTTDECTLYRTTQGVWERGYPSAEIHPDMPLGIVATSELVYLGSALSELVFDNERLVVRAPAVAWGILTIWLLYCFGRRMFCARAGLVAAALYAFSPYAVEMSQVGRYYSQLQGFTLLSTYFMYRTVEGHGPLNHRYLWACVASFVGLFLSWEAAAMMALGMMATAIVLRRRQLGTLFLNLHVWAGIVVVALVVLVQSSHRTLQQTLRQLYGSGATDVSITPMWRFPGFDLWYYVKTSVWTADLLIPLALLVIAGLLTVRHRYRRPARALFIMGLCLAFAQSGILPVTASRYGYHLMVFWVLLGAAAIVAGAERLARVAAATPRPWLRQYARGVSGVVVCLVVLASNGLAFQLTEWRSMHTGVGARLDAFRTSFAEYGAKYVRDHMQPGDAVIVMLPNQVSLYLGSPIDFWIQTQMALQLTLADHDTVPHHRMYGQTTLTSVEQLEHLLATHRRVWLIGAPAAPITSTSSEAASRFFRDNWELVWEDYRTLVYLFGERHLTAEMQAESEGTLEAAPTNPLP